MGMTRRKEERQMTITATFSNGHTDTYKGKRDVKAAWAIIDRATGETHQSGHSLDRAKADKTANGNLRYLRGEYSLDYYLDLPSRYAHQRAYAAKQAKGAGWDGKGNLRQFVVDHNAAITAELRKRTRIEIVDT